jgi:hypothetical protein
LLAADFQFAADSGKRQFFCLIKNGFLKQIIYDDVVYGLLTCITVTRIPNLD